MQLQAGGHNSIISVLHQFTNQISITMILVKTNESVSDSESVNWHISNSNQPPTELGMNQSTYVAGGGGISVD